jgi:hypothetical protein
VAADFTYNTDFAQVEADEQQVNLTRFNLFFPEKREFFLENIGLFSFGGAGGASTTADAGDTPIMFYSRRIGLNSTPTGARAVPILTGGRVSGRTGQYTLGALVCGSGQEPTTSQLGGWRISSVSSGPCRAMCCLNTEPFMAASAAR